MAEVEDALTYLVLWVDKEYIICWAEIGCIWLEYARFDQSLACKWLDQWATSFLPLEWSCYLSMPNFFVSRQIIVHRSFPEGTVALRHILVHIPVPPSRSPTTPPSPSPVSPSSVVLDPHLTVMAGSPQTLECRAVGSYPEANITWTLNGRRLLLSAMEVRGRTSLCNCVSRMVMVQWCWCIGVCRMVRVHWLLINRLLQLCYCNSVSVDFRCDFAFKMLVIQCCRYNRLRAMSFSYKIQLFPSIL